MSKNRLMVGMLVVGCAALLLALPGVMKATDGCPCCSGGTDDCKDCVVGVATTAPATSTAPAEGKIVNKFCPIMPGSAIDPAKVPASLTREYKGQKVGFCCGGCLTAWDKLTDAEKDAKLAAVK